MRKLFYFNRITLLSVVMMISTGLFAQNAFKVPKYEKYVLSNGLTVYLMEEHEIPLISISAIIPAGAVYDGAKQAYPA
jgi:zinc protease